jgi:hypothetical protein
MFRNADTDGMVSDTNSEVAAMTEILLSFPGSDLSRVACSKTSYLQQRHTDVNRFIVWDFRVADILQ